MVVSNRVRNSWPAKRPSANPEGLFASKTKEPDMSPEERARIARENGAKSRGPKTDAGKAQSRLNSIKTGEHATTLAPFVPPTSGILCHEDRQKFYALVNQLTQIFQPVNHESAEMVRQIAIARWQINRLQSTLNSIWNFALLHDAVQPANVVEEHEDDFFAARTAEKLFSHKSPVDRIERHIDRLEIRIARLRRGIKDIHTHFPNTAKPIETQDNTTQTQQPTQNSEPIVYVTENTPDVLAAYRREFPNHKIVILPPDNVAKGINIEDDLPPAPRIAA